MSRNEPFPPLSSTAQATLQKLARMLAAGWTGRVEIIVNRGGVQSMTTGETWRPNDGERDGS